MVRTYIDSLAEARLESEIEWINSNRVSRTEYEYSGTATTTITEIEKKFIDSTNYLATKSVRYGGNLAADPRRLAHEYGRRLDAVQTPRPVLSFRHQTRLLQDPEMLRHGRAADRQSGRDLSDGPGAVAELFENRPPRRIAERLQCLCVSHDLR